ncbi:unnamed protein product [Paramecium sonneborni]|uniref:Thioredoxin domain-containing protein n=1 Tax=Paramecium sonneborni TaxID=65129 RepID=A0A8S1KTE1_9CILI|nr:unnamed protein product [Paramecium sonneborni]
MKGICSVLILCLVATECFGLYEADSKVVKLTKENFKTLVLESNEPWMVEFYAPWCGHCKALAPEYNKAAKALDGIVHIGALDMTTDGEAGQPYGVNGYPTIKYFGVNKGDPIAYEGERKKNGIVDYLLDKAREFALNRLGVEVKPEPSNDDSKVVVLTDGNFNEQVLNSQEAWFVEFYAPWCGHCKQLQPEWNKLSHQADIPIAKVDATAQTELAKRFNIESYPTIYFFPAGNKQDTHRKYEGERNAAALLKYIKEQKPVDGQSQKSGSDVVQINSDERLNELCKQLCVLGFLPSDKVEQEDAVAILKKTALSLTGRANVGWFVGEQFDDFEAELNVIGEGYPQVVVLDLSARKHYRFRRQLTVDNLNEFVKGVIKKTETGQSFSNLPKLNPQKSDL